MKNEKIPFFCTPAIKISFMQCYDSNRLRKPYRKAEPGHRSDHSPLLGVSCVSWTEIGNQIPWADKKGGHTQIFSNMYFHFWHTFKPVAPASFFPNKDIRPAGVWNFFRSVPDLLFQRWKLINQETTWFSSLSLHFVSLEWSFLHSYSPE